jgi:hypothetical protein
LQKLVYGEHDDVGGVVGELASGRGKGRRFAGTRLADKKEVIALDRRADGRNTLALD